MFFIRLIFPILTAMACGPVSGPAAEARLQPADTIPEPVARDANTVSLRFPAPEGFQRAPAGEQDMASYLRDFPLKPDTAPVYLFNGERKYRQDVHAAVLDIDAGSRDLQQCADAVMRLRAEYLFREKRYEAIHFNFTNGFRADYLRWRKGERIRVRGNQVDWVPGPGPDTSRRQFRKYLDVVFSYAGTASLEKELLRVDLQDIRPGDVFIRGGHPGHAVLVMDVAVDTVSGEKLFLLAQSYMPAQDIHILQNFREPDISPWYTLSGIGAQLHTPEWTFERNQLRRFRDP